MESAVAFDIIDSDESEDGAMTIAIDPSLVNRVTQLNRVTQVW